MAQKKKTLATKTEAAIKKARKAACKRGPIDPSKLTAQQKFAKNAGAIWNGMTDASKLKFGKKYMDFVASLRKIAGYDTMSAAQLKAAM